MLDTVSDMVQFLTASNMSAIDIHQQVCEVYRPGAMCEGKVQNWVLEFKNRHENVHDKFCSDKLSVVLGNFLLLMQQFKKADDSK